ncbi:hypothetical protein [Synechococcus sp. MIT S9510]
MGWIQKASQQNEDIKSGKLKINDVDGLYLQKQNEDFIAECTEQLKALELKQIDVLLAGRTAIIAFFGAVIGGAMGSVVTALWPVEAEKLQPQPAETEKLQPQALLPSHRSERVIAFAGIASHLSQSGVVTRHHP